LQNRNKIASHYVTRGSIIARHCTNSLLSLALLLVDSIKSINALVDPTYGYGNYKLRNIMIDREVISLLALITTETKAHRAETRGDSNESFFLFLFLPLHAYEKSISREIMQTFRALSALELAIIAIDIMYKKFYLFSLPIASIDAFCEEHDRIETRRATTRALQSFPDLSRASSHRAIRMSPYRI